MNELKSIVNFFDNTCKGMEGLKDKYIANINECESKNENLDSVLKSWARAVEQLIEEKYEEIIGIKYDPEEFSFKTKQWLINYSDNQELVINVKLLQKSLLNMKEIIRSKIISSDPLCYNNLTDVLIQQSRNKK